MKKLMMMALVAVLLVSCGKDEEEKPVVQPDYANLKVGNYWIYQHYFVDTTGVETALDEYDSCYVEKDTVINGNTYYKMIRPRVAGIPRYYIYLWRDSLGYVVDRLGEIWFAPEDFTTVFDTVYSFANSSNTDTVYTRTSRMVDKDRVITTPAGDFTTRTFEIRYDLGSFLGGDKKTPRFRDFRYAKDVGIVSETLDQYTSVPTHNDRRLVRYGSK